MPALMSWSGRVLLCAIGRWVSLGTLVWVPDATLTTSSMDQRLNAENVGCRRK